MHLLFRALCGDEIRHNKKFRSGAGYQLFSNWNFSSHFLYTEIYSIQPFPPQQKAKETKNWKNIGAQLKGNKRLQENPQLSLGIKNQATGYQLGD
jgi:hypothetical protein